MAAVVLSAILFVAPYLPHRQAKVYARLIIAQATKRNLDPLKVVAVTHHESRFRNRRRSRTNDLGLMQVHVSKTTNPRYQGRELELYAPALNFRLGTRLLQLWKGYHGRHCKGLKHKWWGHYKWGGRVRTRSYGRAVNAILEQIRAHLARSAGSV